MNAPAPEARFDRTKMLTTARRLRRAAEDLEKGAEATLDELKKQAEADTSVTTTSGRPAPIYGEPLATLNTGIEDARARVAGVAEDLRGDAEVLELTARESAASEAEAVQGLGGIDAEMPETGTN